MKTVLAILILGLFSVAHGYSENDQADQAYLWIKIPPNFSFGNVAVGNSKITTLVVKNTGTLSASNMSGKLSGPFRFAGGKFPGTGGNCNKAYLDMNNSCKVVVEFVPQESGAYEGELRVSYGNGYGANTSKAALYGNGY